MGLFDSVDSDNGAWSPYQFLDPADLTGLQAKNNAQNASDAQRAEQARYKAQQYAMLNQRVAPSWSPEYSARIKALEDESKLNLINDPAFQSQVRQATTGGAQALSGIQNSQVARGGVGGFANQGSTSDVYDRLGGQLSQLAQKQNAYAQSKRDTAAGAHQSLYDAQNSFTNAQNDARMAIESGDHAALSDSMNRLYSAKAQSDAAFKQNLYGIGEVVAGAYTGNAKGVKNGAGAVGSSNTNENYGQGPTMDNYNQSMPNYGTTDFASSLGSDSVNYKPYYQSRKSNY